MLQKCLVIGYKSSFYFKTFKGMLIKTLWLLLRPSFWPVLLRSELHFSFSLWLNISERSLRVLRITTHYFFFHSLSYLPPTCLKGLERLNLIKAETLTCPEALMRNPLRHAHKQTARWEIRNLDLSVPVLKYSASAQGQAHLVIMIFTH